MTSMAIENGRPRDWESGGGFRCVNDGCDRAKAVKRYPTRRTRRRRRRRSPDLRREPVPIDCGASETPLWRSGPEGPKSLCNACGIKYRKRKKALEPEAARGNPSGPTGSDGQMREALSPEELKKKQRSKQERMLKLLLLEDEKQRGRREEVENEAEEHGEDVEATALLLMSLSTDLSLHS